MHASDEFNTKSGCRRYSDKTMGNQQAYLLAGWLNNRAVCECGWSGKRRLLHGSAVLDVLDHCAEFGHIPTSIPPTIRRPRRGATTTS